MNKKYILTFFVGIVATVHCIGQEDLVLFEDSTFQQSILNHEPKIDINNDGEIQKSEAEVVNTLNLKGKNINSIQDIAHFTNVIKIVLSDNNLSSVKLSGLQHLEILYCSRNKMEILTLVDLPSLKDVSCFANELTEISLTKLPKLKSLDCSYNKLQEIKLSFLSKLEHLDTSNNALESIYLQENLELVNIHIDNNNIREVDISKNDKLKVEWIYYDDTTTIIGTKTQMDKLNNIPHRKPIIEEH